jgi:ubiquinone/menaquinone biosynthesis C-methylase UbiE
VYPASKAHQLLNPARRLLQPPRRIVRQMCLAPTTRVLEIGSGPGYFSVDLANAVSKGSLVLCDLQAAMLSLARRRTANARNVSAVQGDALSIPFAAESFDAVLLVAVLGEVPDQ